METDRRLRSYTVPTSESFEEDVLSQDSDRQLRGSSAEKTVKEKVDELLLLEQKIDGIKKRHKVELESATLRAKELKMEVEEFARTNNRKSIVGLEAEARFTPSVSRSVNPKRLLEFLKVTGKMPKFWDYVSVTLKSVTADYGEKVLEAEGIIEYGESDPFGTLKIVKR